MAPPHPHYRSAHARNAALAARALGFGFHSLDGDDGFLFEVRDGARSAVFAAGHATPYALNSARAYGVARDKAFANAVWARAGLPTIPSQLFFTTPRRAEHRAPGREVADALAFAHAARWPLFVKPNDASRGAYAEIVDSEAAFIDYLARVRESHEAILVQPVVAGREHRVFVLQGRALFSYRKIAAGPAANRAQGGAAADFQDGAPPALEAIALKAAAAIGLELAGMDVFDVSPEGDHTACLLIEANANPGIETLYDVAREDLVVAIWAANFAAALR
ncbi:MAG: hypothetical protein GC206_06565 [Alphaproteobacteria bacterium]|nr:hypothetical protein [Alphaproteobacteria bacterium]